MALALHDEARHAEFLSHEDLARGLAEGRVKVEVNHFAVGALAARRSSGTDLLVMVPDKEISLVLWRLEFIRRFLAMEAAGEASRSDPGIAEALQRINRSVSEMEVAKVQKAGPRAGRVITLRTPPRPTPLSGLARPFRTAWLRADRAPATDAQQRKTGSSTCAGGRGPAARRRRPLRLPDTTDQGEALSRSLARDRADQRVETWRAADRAAEHGLIQEGSWQARRVRGHGRSHGC